ncbi:MAG: RNA polymerase sigma factor [Methylophilaceae bacterium]
MQINHTIPVARTAIIQDSIHRLTESPVLSGDKFFNMVKGMVAREEASLVTFYDCTLSKVYGLALKITRRHDLAEEVTEDTYMQAWQEASKFDDARGPTMAWLMMICRSRAIDALRRQDEAESHAAPETLKTEIDSTNGPLDILLTLERESDIQLAITTLNPTQRQLIGLAFFKGLTHEEIASQMHMPLGTVKSNIKRAQTKLKAALTQKESSL